MSDAPRLIPLFDAVNVRPVLESSAEDLRDGRVGDLRPQLEGLRRRLEQFEARVAIAAAQSL